MSISGVSALLLLILAPALHAWADDPPAPPPPQHTWIGKGQFGFLNSSGNSVAQAINGNIDLLRYDNAWKNELYVGGLYGKNSGIVSAERWLFREQADYTISGDWFAFGGLRFEHDTFNGFLYQGSISGGLGYKIINHIGTKLTAQVGAGYRRLRPETITKDESGEVISRVLGESTGEAIGTVGVDFSHNLTKTTTLTNQFLLESGADDTLLHDDIALTVKMSDALALSVGYGLAYNTKPPAPLKKLDTVATINLQFGF